MSAQSDSPCLSLEAVWICPPLAFARFGQSETPMESFHWADNDYAPRGTAETVIEPDLTFVVNVAGEISAYLPDSIRFLDGKDWRPVCPFFELHGRLSNGYEGPLGLSELEQCGLGLADVTWEIHAANRKAFHYTLAEGDHVDAHLTLVGDQHRRQDLNGVSPGGADKPLVPPGRAIHLGSAQVIQPNASLPTLRLRITPPKGKIYAPDNVAQRDLSALVPANESQAAFIAQLETFLNPDAHWANWSPVNGDSRTNPGFLYAQTPEQASLGFLDDSNDGLITVTLRGDGVADGVQTAYARYTCCPQDFQPDRRPFTSLADGLADQQLRHQVSDPSYVEGSNWPQTEAEIADLMQRVRETMEASNLDHQNLRSQLANQGITNIDPAMPFTPVPPRPGHPFPLLELGRQNHARFLAYEVFKQRLGQRPELFKQWIRDPAAARTVYNTQMPALMRGSDSYPMTISQRQFDLMQAWLKQVETDKN